MRCSGEAGEKPRRSSKRWTTRRRWLRGRCDPPWPEHSRSARSSAGDDPVEPLLLAVRRSPRFELREPGAQPFERRQRLVLMLVDRRVAEDGEHVFRMRRGLRLKLEAARLDDVHHLASRSCLAAFRSRMTHWALASNLA